MTDTRAADRVQQGPQHMREAWRAVLGFEGRYEVSSRGRVRSRARCGPRSATPGRWRLMRPTRAGTAGAYRSVGFKVNGVYSYRLVHVLVLEAFVGSRPHGHQAAHLDGRAHRNWIENLAWKTPTANNADKHMHGTAQVGERAGAAKLTWAAVRVIRSAAGSASSAVIGRRFGVGGSTIRKILNNESWKAEHEPAGA